MDKITVSAADLQEAMPPSGGAMPPGGTAPFPPPAKPAIPIAARAATLPLLLVLPLLCLVVIAIRLAIRRRLPRVQLAWAHWTNSLLVASGLLTTLLFSMAYFVGPRPMRESAPMPVLEYGGAYPLLPSASRWSAQRLSRETDALVFVVSPELASWRTPKSFEDVDAVGAGLLLEATPKGFLVATNRHVVDAEGFLGPRAVGDSVLLFSKDGGRTRGYVIARHQDLDLALVWTPRGGGDATFLQPIASFAEAETGQNVFVIGHPQRLFFSLSTGIIMRAHQEKMLQISAPVSPGNSGGPVYDEFGRLLAVVSFKVDRRFNPNAENLNFAVRADAILSRTGWTFLGDGESILGRFWDNYDQHRATLGTAPNAPSADDAQPAQH